MNASIGSVGLSDEDRVATDFLVRLRTDQELGLQRPMCHYLALFPEAEELIAREFLLVSSMDRGAVADEHDGVFGPFVLKRVLGRGGQGVVYLAEDTRLGRPVALKILRSDDDLSRLRLTREAHAAARIDHPGICGVHESGRIGGQAYLAMRYVEGRSLAAHLRLEGRLPARQAVTWIAQVADALHAAHEARLLHRDVKPGNVLLGARGPVVLDFGLAHDEVGELQPITLAGEACGTPCYMSPEQLDGRVPVDRRTDVWSLGVILWECLVGERPFDAPTRDGTCHRILHHEPVPPRHLPRDLQVVLKTALAKDPDRRYASAADMAEDLRRYLAWKPITARPPALTLVLRRWMQRNPLLAVASVLLLLSLVGALALTRSFLEREVGLRRRAETALAEVRSLGRMLVFDLHTELRNLPGATRARQLSLERSRELFEKLYSDSGGDPRLQQELAISLIRLGDVLGHPGTGNLADRDGALQCYRRAAELAARASERHPENGDLRVRHAMASSRIADLRMARAPREARALYRESLSVIGDRPLPGEEPHRSRLRATLRYHMAMCSDVMGETARALDGYRAALTLQRAILAERPEEDVVRAELGATLAAVGQLHMTSGDLERAVAATQEAVEVLDGVPAQNDTVVQRFRALASIQLGRALSAAGRLDEGLLAVDRALKQRAALHERDPEDRMAVLQLAQAHVTRADLCRRRDGETAERGYRRALELMDAANDEEIALRRCRARAWIGLAELLAEHGREPPPGRNEVEAVLAELQAAGIRDAGLEELRVRLRGLGGR